jgi:hypothetical protein
MGDAKKNILVLRSEVFATKTARLEARTLSMQHPNMPRLHR